VTDKVRNADIRKQLGTELMMEEIQEYERKWLNNVEMMLPERLMSKEYFYRPAGTREIEHPRRRWARQFI
jgi:hypothetical protein